MEKYILVNSYLSSEYEIDENSYGVTINLQIDTIDGIVTDIRKQIEVISYNSQTGFDVDKQRQLAIDDYMEKINS